MSARLVIHAPVLESEDIEPDSVTGMVRGTKVAPAVRVDGLPVIDHPERDSVRRMEVPLQPGRHRVEVMVKQTYETVQVELAQGETAELRIGYSRDRIDGDDRLFVGTKPYVDRAFASGNSGVIQGVGCGLGLWFVAFAVLGGVAGAFAGSLGLDGAQAILGALGGATVVGLIGGIWLGLAGRRPAGDAGELAPEPIRMGGNALVLPAAVDPPKGRPGIVLRVRPRPRTMPMIGFQRRVFRDARKRIGYEFYYNELIDWVSPPRVILDGQDLGAAWGKWWIPAGTGTHRLRVELDGIGGCQSVGVAEETEVVVEREPAPVAAWFNFLAMAHRREQAQPALVSRWQQVMRRANRYDDLSGQALSEPDLEFQAHQ